MSQRDWDLREYRAGDEEKILALFNHVFRIENPNHIDRTKAQWCWAFEDHGLGHQTLVAEKRDSGEFVGMYTAIPQPFNVRGERLLIGQAVDTCVHPDYRRSLKREGLFLTLARTWFEIYGRPERDCCVYGFPNTRAFPVGTRVLHYRPVHCPVPLLVRSSAHEGSRSSLSGEAVEVKKLERFDASVSALYEKLAPSLGFSTWRTADWMNWRFVANPNQRYTKLGAYRGGQLCGVVVYRIGWIDQKTVPIVDWLVDAQDADVFSDLLDTVSRAARAAQCPTVETWMPEGFDLCRRLRESGFEEREGRFNLCIRIFNPFMDMAAAKQQWYYTMGDSDIY